MKTSEKIEDFLNFLKTVDDQVLNAEADQQRADLETQDILHRLELYNDNCCKTSSITRTLKDIRRYRRIAKDSLEIYQPICAWKSNNKALIKSIEGLLNDVRKAESSQNKRSYRPKTDILKEEKW